MSATMRLDRLLANMGYGSRRDIQQMVRHGCVVLDGAEVAKGAPLVSLAAEATAAAAVFWHGR